MKDRPILYASKPCGCTALVLTVDRDTDRAKIVKLKRAAKRRGYRLEWLTAEQHEARSHDWECPEHHALRVRVAREKVAHQEGLTLKG